MDISETFLMIFAFIISLQFTSMWYTVIFSAWPPMRSAPARFVLLVLPLCSLIAIFITLFFWASFDVVGSIIYIVFYMLLGLVWMSLGFHLMSLFFDISLFEDVMGLRNSAALIAFSGGFLGFVLIYCGANIGDGPGWYCVAIAGGLGAIAWVLLGLIMNSLTGLFERVTVERDLSCGIRFGAYLLASGLILGRSCAGDWTSFFMTVVEFIDGWPVILLTIFAVIVEAFFSRKRDVYNTHGYYESDFKSASVLSSGVVWGVAYIALAIVSIAYLPGLPVNPIYPNMG